MNFIGPGESCLPHHEAVTGMETTCGKDLNVEEFNKETGKQ